MIPASLYQGIYLLIVTILTIVAFSRYKNRDGLYDLESTHTNVFTILLVILISIFIGLRPVSWRYFGDMVNYVQFYETFFEGVSFKFDRNLNNIIFNNLFAWWGSARLGYTSFFVLFATLYFVTTYLGIKKYKK